jgi:hypothetical protein
MLQPGTDCLRLWQVCALRKSGGAEPLIQVDLDPAMGYRDLWHSSWIRQSSNSSCIMGGPFRGLRHVSGPWFLRFKAETKISWPLTLLIPLGHSFPRRGTCNWPAHHKCQKVQHIGWRSWFPRNDHSVSALQEGTKISTKFSDHRYRPSLVALVDSWTCKRTLVYLCLSDVHCGNSWLRRGINNEALAALLPSCEEAEAHNIL